MLKKVLMLITLCGVPLTASAKKIAPAPLQNRADAPWVTPSPPMKKITIHLTTTDSKKATKSKSGKKKKKKKTQKLVALSDNGLRIQYAF